MKHQELVWLPDFLILYSSVLNGLTWLSVLWKDRWYLSEQENKNVIASQGHPWSY